MSTKEIWTRDPDTFTKLFAIVLIIALVFLFMTIKKLVDIEKWTGHTYNQMLEEVTKCGSDCMIELTIRKRNVKEVNPLCATRSEK